MSQVVNIMAIQQILILSLVQVRLSLLVQTLLTIRLNAGNIVLNEDANLTLGNNCAHPYAE